MSTLEDEVQKMGQKLVNKLVHRSLVFVISLKARELSDDDIMVNLSALICCYIDAMCEAATFSSESKINLIKIISSTLIKGATIIENHKNKGDKTCH